MNPIAAPKTLRYEPDAGLPVAIEAKSNRRYFYPNNGEKFGPTQTNVIRMTLNANSFLDFSHSYLQFTVKNTNSAAGAMGVDFGCPFFQRLQIMSGGQELEDIQEYGRLYSILQSVQGSRLTADETSLTQHQPFAGDADDAVSGITAADLQLLTVAAGIDDAGGFVGDGGAAAALNGRITTAIDDAVGSRTGEGASYRHNRFGQVGQNGEITYNVPIISAFFNIDKYFPLLLTEQGLDIYLYLETTKNIGVHDAGNNATANYEINNVRYVAHEVNLDDAFVNQMKASMQATGGVLSLSSTTYRYNNVAGVAKIDSAAGTEIVNISCRVKSLKGMLVRPQAQVVNNNHLTYAISTGQQCGITSAQFRIGSVLYPQSAIQIKENNLGEMYNEIRKCFGTIGSYAHGTGLNGSTFRLMRERDARTDGAGSGSKRQHFLLAYDFETFAKSATESGLNVADRMLPVSLELNRGLIRNNAGAANAAGIVDDTDGKDPNQAIRYDTFAMCDCIIYIDLMGKITTRI